MYTVSKFLASCYIKWVFNFSRKVLNSKASGPSSQLQLSIMLDLDDTFPQRIIMRYRKNLKCTQCLVWMGSNFILIKGNHNEYFTWAYVKKAYTYHKWQRRKKKLLILFNIVNWFASISHPNNIPLIHSTTTNDNATLAIGNY